MEIIHYAKLIVRFGLIVISIIFLIVMIIFLCIYSIRTLKDQNNYGSDKYAERIENYIDTSQKDITQDESSFDNVPKVH